MMKAINVSTKIFSKINQYLESGLSQDEAHEKICSELGLFGVKYFGHGTPYQKRKVEHMWRAVLFCIVDNTKLNPSKKESIQIKNYLKLRQ